MERYPVSDLTDIGAVYDSILYLCEAPVFIWSAVGPKMLKTNDNAARFFLRYPTVPNSSEIDIDKAIPGWHTIPNKKYNSVWLDFRDINNKVSNYQVRNTLLDPDRNIWATTLVNVMSPDGEKKSGSGLFFRNLETTWNKLTENNAGLRGNLSDLTSLIINELGLTSFIFYPSEAFQEFDVYSVLMEPVREKYGWNNETLKHPTTETLLSRMKNQRKKVPHGDLKRNPVNLPVFSVLRASVPRMKAKHRSFAGSCPKSAEIFTPPSA